MNKKEFEITRTVYHYQNRNEPDNTPITVPSVTKYKAELKKSHPDAVRIWFDYEIIETIQIKPCPNPKS